MFDGVVATVVIPTLDRPKELQRCLDALSKQTLRNFDIVILQEPGPLAAIRNVGWRKARGPLVCFIDDDCVPSPGWLVGVVEGFHTPSVMGVSGPSPIPEAYQAQRDLFRFRRIKRLYDWAFLNGWEDYPGHITPAGAFTTGAANPHCSYEGPVHFLEACNMSFRKSALVAVGGFDEEYAGIGDWSEPDLSFRVRQRFGDACLLFTQGARLEHRPSRTGAYLLRTHTGARLRNYYRFARRWVPRHWRATCYRGFLHAYYTYKECCTWLPYLRHRH